MLIDDPDGESELVQGTEPLPANTRITELKRKKKAQKVQGKKMMRRILQNIKVMKYIRDHSSLRLKFGFTQMDESHKIMPHHMAEIAHHGAVAWKTNLEHWTFHFNGWKRTASYGECRTPLQLIEETKMCES